MMTPEVAKRLARLAAAAGGDITPAVVVEDAKDPDSPLHEMFEWDVDTAAHNHWIGQARKIIKAYVPFKDGGTKKVVDDLPDISGFVRSPTADPEEQGFATIEKVRTREDWSGDTMAHELKTALAYVDRASKFADVVGKSADCNHIRDSISKLLDSC